MPQFIYGLKVSENDGLKLFLVASSWAVNLDRDAKVEGIVVCMVLWLRLFFSMCKNVVFSWQKGRRTNYEYKLTNRPPNRQTDRHKQPTDSQRSRYEHNLTQRNTQWEKYMQFRFQRSLRGSPLTLRDEFVCNNLQIWIYIFEADILQWYALLHMNAEIITLTIGFASCLNLSIWLRFVVWPLRSIHEEY